MFKEVPNQIDFPAEEKRILDFWEKGGIYQKSLDRRKGGKPFVFFEGPPTANGLPHPGHCLTRAIKDLFPRYKTMTGHHCLRKGGWDTHGLPVEVEVCKELGIHTKEEIEAYGVEAFNRKCLESVFRYTQQWEEMTRRLGFWVNLEEAYVTYHQSYIESVWWSLKQLFDAGLLYQGHKIVWWWAQGGTALSSGEVGLGYREVDDPSVFVRFPIVMDERACKIVGSIGVPPVRTNSGYSRGAMAHRPVTPHLDTRRRILPHWEMGGSTYFLTFRLHEGTLTEEERTFVLDACRHWNGQRFDLHAAVVMPDHVHLLCTPLEQATGQWWSIADLMHGIKGFTANELNNRRGATGFVWQREYYDRIIRNEKDFEEKWSYVVMNPERRGLPEGYPWVWVEGSGAGEESHRRDADAPRASLVVWTTTPWTLPSNMFAAVHPEIEYAIVHDAERDEYLVLAAALVEAIAKKVKAEAWRVVRNCKGAELVGLRYVPPFRECYYDRAANSKIEGAPSVLLGDFRAVRQDREKEALAWRVMDASFVTIEAGTGIVHEAPAFGEVDFELWRQGFWDYFAPPANQFLPCAVAPNGSFTDEGPAYCRGRWVKDCDKDIIRDLKERKAYEGSDIPVLLHQEQYRHDYPFCWRADQDPLIQYPRRSWFIRTTQFKDDMLENNQHINWLPEHIKAGRFGKFLESNVDWSLSRERYWGTPLPIWKCEACGHMEAVDSYDTLVAMPGAAGMDVWNEAKRREPNLSDHLKVHKPYIDEITYACPKCDQSRKTFDQSDPPRADQGAVGSQSGGPSHSQADPSLTVGALTDAAEALNDSRPGGGSRMRRVPEVIDCWYDSGAMPFAQWGYPHKNREMFAKQFPADFISEALDQTRGWFYSLTAIATMLFGKNGTARGNETWPLPFKTCIVLGLLMGEDGLKMSKSKKNYKEPTYIFDHEGADAMRWLFFSGQPPWTSIRFQESAIAEGQREFLIRLYNCYSFFVIYANIDQWTPSGTGIEGWRDSGIEGRSELDRWILSELAACCVQVFDLMEAYDNFNAAKTMVRFVDALSNWYVRRNRDRFWRSGMDADKNAAYATLHTCLVTFAKLMAPFMPFIAESMYRNLTGIEGDGKAKTSKGQNAQTGDVPESVHLCDYPVNTETRASVAARIDEKLNEEVELVRQLVSCGRAARAATKLRVRQPLAAIELYHRREDVIRRYEDIIRDELNVKRIEYVSSERIAEYVHYEIKPDFRKIGPKHGPLAPKIKALLAKHSNPDAIARQLEREGVYVLEIDQQSVELSSDEVKVELHAREGWAAAGISGQGILALDSHLTPELIDEGCARDLVNSIQQVRKTLNLRYEQRIDLAVVGDEFVGRVVHAHAAYIKGETLAEDLLAAAIPGAEAVTVDLEGHPASVYVKVR